MHERGSSRGHHGNMAQGLGACVNYFGLFISFSILISILGYIAYELGYEKAIQDIAEKYEIISE
jgi:hypothetical protein